MTPKKKDPMELGSGMKFVRGGIASTRDISPPGLCGCEPFDAEVTGEIGNTGCACGCENNGGTISTFDKAIQMLIPVLGYSSCG